ncbi:DNA mismatch repair protein [Venturia nashicola]|uniref:DNA mismatch repair protein n=1 Tax=Venturia nashicola TaxID=86259 RepID=A0A4Z1NY84_9PEZI|nr:DNA mismatch repair protein [Venturia nashicola]TLD18865.1 DNA mismatch repair protein [Venturia nashicola]
MNQPAPPRPRQSEIPSAPAIVALPIHVAAQIKSSATITSLISAILGLVQNSLDAQATQITIDVDFKRGGCVVEDDGVGILPTEFGENGGLGKLYHTSKYKIADINYGCNGVFLYSLASLCLLNITSHHRQHRSTNSLTFHHSKPIARLVPAPPSHSLDSRSHGTKVSVRDIFGNMPVRVKQRYLASEDRSELGRLWESLKQSIVSLLIASWSGVALKMRDMGSSKSLTLSAPRERNPLELGPGPPERLRTALSVLQQASMLSPGSIGSWIPASASCRSILIKGGICLEPAPSKSTQFLSLGLDPLPRSSHNELYDHINRLFSRSRFGMVEEEPLTETEKLRRQQDRRFKQDGLTNKQLLAEKGVDRWPMFVLSISFRENGSRQGHQTLDSDTKLASVISVLGALIEGWLASNHFRPQKRKAKEQDPVSESEGQSTAVSEVSLRKGTHSAKKDRPAIHREKRLMSRQRLLSPTRPYTGVSSMNKLSRIKTSNRSLLEQGKPYTPGSKRPQTAPDLVTSIEKTPSDDLAKRAETSMGRLAYISDLSRKDLQSDPAYSEDPSPWTSEAADVDRFSIMQDEAIRWTDPITKQIYRLNSRTGAVIAPEPRKRASSSAHSSIPDRRSQNVLMPSLRLPPRVESINEPTQTGWLDGVLKNWQNPVFRCTEKGIQQASLHLPGEETGAIKTGKFEFTTTAQIDQAFKEVSHLNASRITKQALRNAKVISQVDKKFVLVSLSASHNEDTTDDAHRSMLVMIDQHAADERIKVERLLQELSKPPPNTETPYVSSLGYGSPICTSLLSKPLTFRISAREIEHFRTHAECFAEWGILYDLTQPSKDSREEKQSDFVLRCLPPVIAERCKSDPKLLINLLRSELWNLVDSSSSSHNRPKRSSAGEGEENNWLKTIGSFPKGILDMLNSRACRSAIMFNDVLSKQDCEELVKALAKCMFPFVCAHGRPSMVPLLDLGGIGGHAEHSGLSDGAFGRREEKKSNFMGAFGRWKEEGMAQT